MNNLFPDETFTRNKTAPIIFVWRPWKLKCCITLYFLESALMCVDYYSFSFVRYCCPVSALDLCRVSTLLFFVHLPYDMLLYISWLHLWTLFLSLKHKQEIIITCGYTFQKGTVQKPHVGSPYVNTLSHVRWCFSCEGLTCEVLLWVCVVMGVLCTRE